MLLKLIGIIIIIFATTTIGQILAKRLTSRLIDLRDAQKILSLLQKEIQYLQNSIPDCFENISKYESRLCRIFSECSELLKSRKGFGIEEAWKKSVENNFESNFLNDDDKTILLGLGKGLGCYDIENQVNSIQMTITLIESQLRCSEDVIMKNSTLYKKLGLLSGIAAAIILV